MRVAVTGHMNLTTETEKLVEQALISELASCGEPHELTGISCIARGADTVFAQAVVAIGGRLEVVLPSADYRQTKVKSDHAAQFDKLMSRAERVHVGTSATADRAAYEEANEVLLSSCDMLFAIWDGMSGVDKGGTANVVKLAESRGLPVRIIWPTGARRD